MTRRARRRVEVALVLLAFPVAVALTVVALGVPEPGARAAGAGNSKPPAPAIDDVSVAVSGGAPVPAFSLADALSRDGYDVVAVAPDENAVGSATEVVYYDRRHLPAAARLQQRLGVGTIRRDQAFSPSSDLMILIGKDLKST